MSNVCIPHSRPCLGEAEQVAVSKVLARGQLAQGVEVRAFEQELADFLGVPEAVALANGTAGLHLALLSLGAGPGKNVILPTYACVSLLNAVAYTGAEAVLVDSEPESPDMDLELARQAATPDTVAAVLPHLFGRAVSSPSTCLGGVPLLEDATQSLGARDENGRLAGSNGCAGVYSFYATKMIAGGEGGALTGAASDLLKFARDRREYDGRDDWQLRFNYKMSEITAALLRTQLSKLPDFLHRRQQIARYYARELGNCSLLTLPQSRDGDAWYRFVVLVAGNLEDVMMRLEQAGVSARRPVFKPIHHYVGGAPRYPHAENYWKRALSIPLYPDLSDEEVERVALEVRGICS